MKKMLFVLLPVILLTACKKEEEPITYPSAGHYGENILYEDVSQFYLSPDYSMHALLPEGKSIKVIMTNTSSNVNSELWFYVMGSNVNLIISEYNETTGVQTFESTEGAAEIDLNMSFMGSGSATVDIYENDATAPTRTKNIHW